MPTPPTPPTPPGPPRPKAVTFRPRCDHRPAGPPEPDERYHSDPGGRDGTPKTKRKKPKDSDPDDLKYYSEPDAGNYFEIDYAFLKELRRIARRNCPKCKRKRERRRSDRYVYCNGGYHGAGGHCQLCCRACSRSSLDEDLHSSASRSCDASTPRSQSSKSVSFLQSSTELQEQNYTAKSFTNDLKRFLLEPPPPRVSLRDKIIGSIKQELVATKRSPKMKAIKGLWKSY